MLLRRHNLNLLPILRELLRTRSVSRTAERVGLSQSAVSAALARLRETFGDELLVMVGRRLELTARGAALVEQTERANAELEALLQPVRFDPATLSRRFVVAGADYAALLVAPRLAALLAAEAPLASAHFTDTPDNVAAEALRGRVDALIVPEGPGEARAMLKATPLWRDEMVVIAARERRPFAGPLTREAYLAARHAMFRMSPRNEATHALLGLKQLGVEQRDVVMVQQFATLPAVVEASGCLALIQRRLAERFAACHAIEIHAAPFDLPPLKICAYWPPAMERDPAHAWFRSLLLQARPADHGL
jgi:DNA-binding transcriptional LysR family regulator